MQEFESHYLNAKLLPLDKYSEISPEELSSLEVPLQESYAYGESGLLQLEKGSAKLEISYRKITDEHERAMLADEHGLKNPFKLERMALSQKDGGTLDKDVVRGLKIYFDPTVSEAEHSHYNMPDHAIFILGDILKPKMLFLLLHEMGHAVETEKSPQEAEKVLSAHMNFHRTGHQLIEGKNFTEAEAELVLRSERNANAYALGELRPYADDLGFSKKQLGYLIYAAGLKTYSDILKKYKQRGYIR